MASMNRTLSSLLSLPVGSTSECWGQASSWSAIGSRSSGDACDIDDFNARQFAEVPRVNDKLVRATAVGISMENGVVVFETGKHVAGVEKGSLMALRRPSSSRYLKSVTVGYFNIVVL